MPQASPVLPTPVLPMKTMFSALAMKSSSAKARICLRLTPGWLAKGKVSSDQTFGQAGPPDARLQSAFLPGMPLGAQQPGQEIRVGDVFFLGSSQLFVIDLEDALQVQVFHQLFEFFSHVYLLGLSV